MAKTEGEEIMSEQMMTFGNHWGVLEGYAALNFVPNGWKGVIAGNRYCKEYRDTSAEALQDAKNLFETMGC